MKALRIRRITAIFLVMATLAALLVAGTGVAEAEPGGIVISELNYHAGSDLDTDDFLELTNTGTTAIDVSGWSFTSGVTGVLPAASVISAGGRYVVAKDAAQFQITYGFAPDAVYGGNLSNSGELVAIADASLVVIDQVSYLDVAPWPGAPDGTGPSLELVDLLSDNTLPESWLASTVSGGTPRAVNSVNGIPIISQVTATPHQPDPNQPVTVTARLPVGAAAQLTYKILWAANVVIPFLDNAASPGGAGDGVYAATIPGQLAGRLIRYRIDATTPNGSVAFPAVGDTINFAGVVVRNPSVPTGLPVIEWFMDNAVYNDLLANHRFDDVTGPAVIAYNGTVYDNATMRVRGNSSRSLPKVNWKVEMPKGYELDLGALLPYKLDEWALQREPDPFADVGWATVREAGARSLSILPVRSQRNGTFWSLGRVMELEDGAWRDAQGVDDWAIYKGDGGSLAKTASPAALQASLWLDKKTREDEDYSDVWNLSQVIDNPASASQKQWMWDNLNLPELVNYMAINSIIRHQDSGWYNWYITRDTEGTGRWEMWHWDLNWIFTTGSGTFLTPDTSNRMTTALLRYPEIQQMFYRRLRTLADQFLVPPRYENRWDAIVAPTLPAWTLENQMWGGYTPNSARSSFISGLTNRRNVIANNTGAGRPVPVSQSAAPNIVINELQYNPLTGETGEFIELRNPSATEAVDLSGWTIDAIGLTIQAGTVLLPNAHVVFVKNDAAFRAAYGPPLRFVGGEYSGNLANEGETVTLRQGTRVVDEVTYSPNAPWPTAANGLGPSLELVSPTADNSLPGNWTANALIRGTPAATNTVVSVTDNVPPTTSITAPAEGASVAGATTVQANANDNIGVTSVALRVDGIVVATDTSAPYSFTWNATGVGAHTLQTVASDAAGNTGLSAVVNVTVEGDSVPPTTSITSPAEGAAVFGSTPVQANANDNIGVTSVALRVDGNVIGTDSVAPYVFTWNATAVGAHTLQTVATDGAGNTGESTIVNVTVPNDTTPPTAPGSLAASNVAQQSLTLSWTASSDARGVTGYQIVRNGTTLPGTVTGLTFNDTGLTAATAYTYTVRALDAAGNVSPDSNTLPVTTLAVSSSLFTDLWPGANGSAWGSGWATSATNGAVNTQTNAGQLTYNNVAGAFARAQLTGVAARANAEVLFSYRWNATTAKAYFSVNLRGSGGWLNAYRPRSGYGLELSSNSNNITVTKAVNGTTTNLATVASAGQMTTAKQWIRLRVVGSTIQFKRWLDTQTEPTAWTSTSTDTALTTPGQLFLSLARSSTSTGVKAVFIDDLALRDGS